MVTINSAGFFTIRPSLGSEYLSPEGERVTIAASWPGGVVFSGNTACSATELLSRYIPYCKLCGVPHNPGEPHQHTCKFNEHIQNTLKRPATAEDTYSHCQGLMFEAAAIATRREL